MKSSPTSRNSMPRWATAVPTCIAVSTSIEMGCFQTGMVAPVLVLRLYGDAAHAAEVEPGSAPMAVAGSCVNLPAMATTTPPYVPRIRLYQNWLAEQRGLSFDSYDALWRWSTTDLDAYWQSVWDY